jgi:hypothetical protein
LIGSAIREFASGHRTPWVCAAFNERFIEVWDLATRQQLAGFEAQFVSGAANLALHPSGTLIATGISEARKGVIATYELPVGNLLWERKRLSYPDRLRFSPSGEHLYGTINNGRVDQLDARTGEVSRVINNACDYCPGPYRNSLIVPKSGSAYLIGGTGEYAKHDFQIPKLTFAVLDVAFAPNRVFLTESGGPVRGIDCEARRELWRFDPPEGSHVLSLHWNTRDKFVRGILRQYEQGLFRQLVRFDPEDGRAERICDLDSWAEAFVDPTNEVITSRGNIIDLSSGRIVDKLKFPKVQYADKLKLGY